MAAEVRPWAAYRAVIVAYQVRSCMAAEVAHRAVVGGTVQEIRQALADQEWADRVRVAEGSPVVESLVVDTGLDSFCFSLQVVV
jgi:hypothetical protein